MTYWLIGNGEIDVVLNAGLPLATLQAVLNTPNTFVFSGPSTSLPLATPTGYYTDYQVFANDVQAGKISEKYVIYDNEDWNKTPTVQQEQPFRFAAMFTGMAHKYGIKTIFTPATNLASVVNPSGPPNRFENFVQINFAGGAAPFCDILEVQAQQDESDGGAYGLVNFVKTTQAQARAKVPGQIFLAGIGGAAAPSTLTGAQLVTYAQSIVPYCDGFWLNVTPNIQTIVEFLEQWT